MTEWLITRISFKPKASNASDFDKVTVAKLSAELKEIISDTCGWLASGCYRRECKGEHIKFKRSIDTLVQASSVLPGNFVAHVHNQAEK